MPQLKSPSQSPCSVRINGERRDVPSGVTVAELLQQLEVRPRGTAVEVNGVIVRSTEFSVRTIKAGDEIEIVTLVGGG